MISRSDDIPIPDQTVDPGVISKTRAVSAKARLISPIPKKEMWPNRTIRRGHEEYPPSHFSS